MGRPHEAPSTPRALPTETPDLIPFIPLIYVAWADGILSARELEEICQRIEEETDLDADTRSALESWLQPESPPTASQLTELRERLRREARELPAKERRSLATLGVGMARHREQGAVQWGTAEGMRRLEALEDLLGVLGEEAARDLLAEPTGPEPEPAVAEAPRSFDIAGMTEHLEGEFVARRQAVLELLRDPNLQIPRNLPSAEYRERTLKAVQHLAQARLGWIALPRKYGGEDDLAGSIVTFETLAYGDLSVLIKYGVQFGLFGGSILQLGSERHHRRFLEPMANLELPGCFAMTERNHGSNVRELETVACYLPEKEEFEILTPHHGARKDWIGNAAEHGRMATVFARLQTLEEDHGVHAFLVPIRNENGNVLDGIRIEDCGDKVGLQGVDNGRIEFQGVRIPRENLLDRFAEVREDGTYESPIPSDGKRFFTMLGTLVSGRISIAAASLSASKTALAVAVRFSARRRQFGPSGQPEVPVLDYLTQQRALLPRVAASYGVHFAVRDLIRAYPTAETDEERGRVDAMAAGLKAYASRHAQESIQLSREACGGRGYLAENRFGELRNDTDVFTTFEGANVVLLQLVARSLLTRFRDEMGDLRFWGTLRFLAERAGTAASRRNPVRSRRTGEDHLRDLDFQREAFSFREQRLLETVARRLKDRIDEGMDSFQAMNECQDHLVSLARSHIEKEIFASFVRGVENAPTEELTRELEGLRNLWALWRLEVDRAWFLESGYMEGVQTKAIRSQVNDLVSQLRSRAVDLVDAFGIPDDLLKAPAAFGE